MTILHYDAIGTLCKQISGGEMHFELSPKEKQLLLKLKGGVQEIQLYKVGLYPVAISFMLSDKSVISLDLREEDIAWLFEIFPLVITEKTKIYSPETIIPRDPTVHLKSIFILQKSEWSLPASDEDKQNMFGNTENAQVQCEGCLADIPSDALNQATYDAGIKLIFEDGYKFTALSAAFPLSFYVSGCSYSDNFDEEHYEVIELYNKA